MDSNMERVRPQPAEGRRQSIFTEVGLVDEDTMRDVRMAAPMTTTLKPIRPARMVRFRSRNSIYGEAGKEDESDWESVVDEDDESDAPLTSTVLPAQSTMPLRFYRLSIFAFVLAVMLPILSISPISRIGVRGGMIPRNTIEAEAERSVVVKRADSPTDACKRWAGQSTIVNGTLYMYGFRQNDEPKGDQNTWNNNFLSLDLTKSWQISNPSLTGLPQPSGPPAVSLGTLWGSASSLWLYGGQYSDKPKVSPGPNSVWEYDISGKQWKEHKSPKTSGGDAAEDDGQDVQRAAEGASFSVASLGRGWYFGGHLDDFTTEGWSNQVARLYLKSLLEFTFPGFSNNAVNTLKTDKKAGSDGVFRNITQGGLQNTGSFPARADGLLTYVPGFGDEGLLIGFTGGDNDTFTQLNVIDVYDIAKSTWYKQSTSGDTIPPYRVNACAAVAAAADGSSYNIYMYGGQNLQPFGDQTQKDDMWILSVPSFQWVQVDQQKQKPYARAGHSCHVWDGQMIVVGGYIDPNLSCESPGVYVFNMSSLSWSDQFTALTGNVATEAFSGPESKGNPLAQQFNQRGYGANSGLQGSYGYAVPAPVQQAIGGVATGGATLTAPLRTPTAGPLATGKPLTWPVPNNGTNGGNNSSNGPSGPNIGAIIAGVIAGVFFLIACYFAFCAWIYRKQVQIWKNHAAMVQTRANNEKQNTLTSSSGKNSSERPPVTLGSSHGAAAGSFDIARGASGGDGYTSVPAGEWTRRSSNGSIHDDLLSGQEPSFWGTRGVLLNPRRSLRVINRD
ncbi:hypothetical protein HBH56_021580 [Parastagonospora nodorum]|uniref:Kelch repeat-containing protein n=1 Tax=Phaeosphaeria nodorum (strain SN15 / ATCC MYA-4574 / FGSC 10173) TaxID=321614 RepID=A0A7U2HYN6_PHANO|nr:hypothetical protein HBH56_021580 [Parastagonospora nodorum]QRC95518.1 hypothetical protein JI435_032020 [Parastagonospora nodorum SN15]KAH3936922.1 hypothetical protein HBH54_012910 [Parastagonospora nodorum]KAH3944028.1 hypothetical protein HBH53_163840 [Parastagonospora nodorum]KAH4117017.1 hypothetical protein HBH47_159290 [Parastagonospora nodorum]